MNDDDVPISYQAAARGTPVLSSTGATIGALEHVLEVPEVDVFDGIVIATDGGLRFIDADQIVQITRSCIRSDVDDARARQLPPPDAPPDGLGPTALGSVFVVYLIGLVTTPVSTRGAARFGRRTALAAAVALDVAGLLISLFGSLAAIIAGLALIAGGVFIEQALATGFIGVAAGRARSAAVGLYVTSYYIGGSLGGIVPAGLWHRFGWPGCVALGVAVQLVVLATALPTWREVRR